MSFLNFVSAGTSESGKTQRWTVQTLGGTVLGWISWFPAWRKYTFSVGESTFDAGCLREIATYIETETFRHKNKKEANV